MVLEIEAMGDPAELSEKGWFKGLFENSMARYAKEIEDGTLAKVGLNCHQIPDEEDTLLKEVVETKIDPYWGRIEEIKEYKESRDQSRLKDGLRQIHDRANTDGENVMHLILNAFEMGATMGEIGGTLRMAYDSPYDPYGLVESPV